MALNLDSLHSTPTRPPRSLASVVNILDDSPRRHCFLGLAQCYDEWVAQWYVNGEAGPVFLAELDGQIASTSSSAQQLASAVHIARGSPMLLHPGSSMVRHASIMYAFSLLTLALEFLKLRRVLTQVFHAR